MEHLFFVVGPTATGKSKIAADVAARCGAEIVSADAFQLYRGLPLLTAQPDAATLRNVPHHLIDCVPVTEEMNAQKFREMVVRAIGEISSRDKPIIVVGGSGLYIKALTHGLASLPAVDLKLRAKLNALSLDELNAQLAAVDPPAAIKIDRHHKRRVIRALEIFAQTNAPASALRTQWKDANHAQGVFVFRDRSELYARIDRRVEQMFLDGVIKEVGRITDLSATAAQALGLAQIRQLLAGEVSEPECIAAIQQATRRYAKRQLTWFRCQTNFEPLNLSLLKDHEAAVDRILQKAKGSFALP